MLHISRPEGGGSQSAIATVTQNADQQLSSSTNATNNENKKYTKRRYTDSRHQTRHIPDADTLAGKTPITTSNPSISNATVTSTQSNSRGSIVAPVWKRRELISSAPKDRETYF